MRRATRVLPILGLAVLTACTAYVNATATVFGGDTSSTSTTSTTSTTTSGTTLLCGDEVPTGGAGDTAYPTSCNALKVACPGTADGVHTIDPDSDGPNVAFDAYCDMTADGGGWTLVAKVHRWHTPPYYDEPFGWFAAEHDTITLLDPLSYESRPVGNASHGEGRIGPMIPAVTQARFTVIAEDDVAQRASWFKAVDAGLWAWFSGDEHAPTLVCSDVDMTLHCSPGRIRTDGDATWLEGMLLEHHGYTIDYEGCSIVMRLNQDLDPEYSGVCSCTRNHDNNAWHDDAWSEHFGNGLEIWLR